MKFFFADNLDTVNPNFNFKTEETTPERYRQSSDLFAHEILESPPYDGILLSHAAVHGNDSRKRFSQSQAFRLEREGVHNFYRFPGHGKEFNRTDFPIIGDCGSFSYINMKQPAITPREMVDFYQRCQFTHGVSPDHVITAKNKDWDNRKKRPAETTLRAELTLNNARIFMQICNKENVDFEPIGCLQFWSPQSAVGYAKQLIDLGYNYLGLGGLTGRRTDEIIEILAHVRSAIPENIRLHIFGLNRFDRLEDFHGLDLFSFDSTSPLIKAFKDDRHNYFSEDQNHYIAIRVPNADEQQVRNKRHNDLPKEQSLSVLQRECLKNIQACVASEYSIEDILSDLRRLRENVLPGRSYTDEYTRVLTDRPWEQCACAICKRIGHEVIIFRGIVRNKSRGFHNLYVFYKKLESVRNNNSLRFPCLQAKQNEGKYIYSFVANGKDIPKFASVSRITRNEDGLLEGYQRPEIEEHVDDIARYLSHRNAILPNSIVIAFDKPLLFEPSDSTDANSTIGTITLPIGNQSRSGWIVDGQQRTVAIRKLARSNFPVSIIAFASKSIEDERTQFFLINSAKPLPKSLVYELLPSIDKSVPKKLIKRQKAYRVLERLNLDPHSPFFQRIKTTTTKGLDTVLVQDTSVLKMIENSLENGALARFGESFTDIHKFLSNYWTAIQQVYTYAWDMKPKESRLTHGVGIVSMGYIMDAISYKLDDRWNTPPVHIFKSELQSLGMNIAWTEGSWKFSNEMIIPWNELQNTTRHIELVTNYLIRIYRE